MTNHWIDIKNSDVVMCIGSNAAENHPISFKWVQEALDDGAKLIVVDPRYTRTASKASFVDGVQLYCRLRSGTDIAFILGMMKWAVDHDRINWDYVRDCTNASYLINPSFETCRVPSSVPTSLSPTPVTGVFSGLVPDPRRQKKYKYDTNTWQYQYADPGTKLVPLVDRGPGYWDTTPPGGTEDPNSVWTKFKEQISVYSTSKVCDICGCDPAVLQKVYDVYTSTYQDQLSANIMYAMGATQHTYGSQNVRSYAMLQLLLGNVGVAGGGINALRGESNVQGSTDMCLLWHILPGYLNVTTNSWAHRDRAAYKFTYSNGKAPQDITPVSGAPGYGTGNPRSLSWWSNGGKYIDSLLQAWWPAENMPGYAPGNESAMLDTAYGYLPKAKSGFWYTHE
jgi:formate dehydrogenase major subunit